MTDYRDATAIGFEFIRMEVMSLNNKHMNDWRLQGQERYLGGIKLTHRRYKPMSTSWDHDHCEFCGSKFSVHQGDFAAGYVSMDLKHWICDGCYNDFKERFHWVLVSEADPEAEV